MKTVHKSVLIWYSAEEMFALVTDVAKYDEFLPWCDRAAVIALEPDGMKAEIGIAFGGIHQTFTTRNHHVPGREVRMKLVDGPFSNLDGCWKFTPLGQAGQRCLQRFLADFQGGHGRGLHAVETLRVVQHGDIATRLHVGQDAGCGAVDGLVLAGFEGQHGRQLVTEAGIGGIEFSDGNAHGLTCSARKSGV